MDDNKKNRLLLKRFLLDKLSKEESVYFNKHKEEFLSSGMFEEEVVYLKGRQELKAQLQNIARNQNSQKEKSFTKKKLLYISGIAASVLILISINFLNNSIDSSSIYNEFYEPYPNIYTQKGYSDNVSELDYYDDEDYNAAIKVFETKNKKQSLSSTDVFYYGISLLEVNRVNDAITAFKTINPDHFLYLDARWYIALGYLKNNNTQDAKQVLISIEEQVGKNKQLEIEELLHEINQL